jgi:hypothetical protein
MQNFVPAVAALCALAAGVTLASPAADAQRYRGIQCEGVFQVTKYGLHASPFCEERRIAQVARSYGYRVTDKEVQQGGLKKIHLCQALGYDNRLKEACAPYFPPRGRR